MRACVIEPGRPDHVALYQVAVWKSPTQGYTAVMAVPAGTMTGPEAIQAVCHQLECPIPPPSDRAVVLVGPEAGNFVEAVRKAVYDEWMRK